MSERVCQEMRRRHRIRTQFASCVALRIGGGHSDSPRGPNTCCSIPVRVSLWVSFKVNVAPTYYDLEALGECQVIEYML